MIQARGRGLRGALALLASSGIWVLASAAPAAAYVCAFGIDSPTAGSVSGAAAMRVSGPFSVRQGSADRIIEISFTRSPGPAPQPVVRRGDEVGPPDRYDVPVGPLSLNGPYTARVTARHAGTGVLNCDEGIGGSGRDAERTATVSFGVSVRAKPPVNVKASFDPGPRHATVTWGSSDDPDIAGYTITRRIGDETSGVDVPPDPLSWTDTSLPAGAATITYSVQAARNGPAAGTTSERSDPVAAGVDVPAPSAPPTTGAPPPGSGAPGGTTATTRPFVLGRSVGGSESPPATVLRLPSPSGTGDVGAGADPGPYRPLIPYTPDDEGEVPPQWSMAIDDGNDQAMVGEGRGELGDEGVPGLAYVAAAMLSTVVAAHVLWLRRQALRPDPSGAGRPPPPLEPIEPPAAPPDDPAPDAGASSPFHPGGPEPVPERVVPERVAPERVASGPVASERMASGSVAPVRTPRPSPPRPAALTTATSVDRRDAILRPSGDGSLAFAPAAPPPDSRVPASSPIGGQERAPADEPSAEDEGPHLVLRPRAASVP